MNRRNFLKSTAALFVAPAIVHAENLMKIKAPPPGWELAEGGRVLVRKMGEDMNGVYEVTAFTKDDIRTRYARESGHRMAEGITNDINESLQALYRREFIQGFEAHQRLLNGS